METPAEYEARIARLEHQRAERHANMTGTPGGSVWPSPEDIGTGSLTVEVGPGRGDFAFGSGNYPNIPTSLALIGNRAVSFARLFQSQPWVASAVMWMLTKAARVPLNVYRRNGDDPADKKKLRVGEHPLADAIDSPWNRGSTLDLVMAMLGPVLVHGNSVVAVDDTPNHIQFQPYDWRYSRPIMPFRDSIEGFTFNIDAPKFQTEVSIDKVMHTKWWSPVGPIGTSPLQQLGVTMQIEDAAQRWQRAQFQNGARPASAITMSDEFLGIDAKQRRLITAQIRDDIHEIYSGPENAGRPALLPPGLDWKQVGHSSVEVELIQQRKITREEVCVVYLIPLLTLLGIEMKGTFASIQVMRDMTYTDCLGPPLILLEQTLNAQIVRDLLRFDDVFLEFDFAAVLRGDRLQEIDALRGAISSALMTPNEGRSVLNMPHDPNPGMDEFYLPVNNLQPVGTPAAMGVNKPTFGPPGSTPMDNLSRRLHVRSREADYTYEPEPRETVSEPEEVVDGPRDYATA